MSLPASASALGSLHSAPQRAPLPRPGSASRALLFRNDVCTRSLASGRRLKRNLVCASAPSEAVELDAEAPSLDSESKKVGPSDLEIDPILEQELSQNAQLDAPAPPPRLSLHAPHQAGGHDRPVVRERGSSGKHDAQRHERGPSQREPRHARVARAHDSAHPAPERGQGVQRGGDDGHGGQRGAHGHAAGPHQGGQGQDHRLHGSRPDHRRRHALWRHRRVLRRLCRGRARGRRRGGGWRHGQPPGRSQARAGRALRGAGSGPHPVEGQRDVQARRRSGARSQRGASRAERQRLAGHRFCALSARGLHRRQLREDGGRHPQPALVRREPGPPCSRRGGQGGVCGLAAQLGGHRAGCGCRHGGARRPGRPDQHGGRARHSEGGGAPLPGRGQASHRGLALAPVHARAPHAHARGGQRRRRRRAPGRRRPHAVGRVRRRAPPAEGARGGPRHCGARRGLEPRRRPAQLGRLLLRRHARRDERRRRRARRGGPDARGRGGGPWDGRAGPGRRQHGILFGSLRRLRLRTLALQEQLSERGPRDVRCRRSRRQRAGGASHLCVHASRGHRRLSLAIPAGLPHLRLHGQPRDAAAPQPIVGRQPLQDLLRARPGGKHPALLSAAQAPRARRRRGPRRRRLRRAGALQRALQVHADSTCPMTCRALTRPRWELPWDAAEAARWRPRCRPRTLSPDTRYGACAAKFVLASLRNGNENLVIIFGRLGKPLRTLPGPGIAFATH